MSTETLPKQVAAAIIRDIHLDRMEPGARLAPARTLAERYKASYVTVQKALKVLSDEAIIETRRGSGSYLLRAPEAARVRGIPASINRSKAPRRIGVLLPVWGSQGGRRAVYEMLDGFTNRCAAHDWRVELITPGIQEINSPKLTARILNEHFDGVAWLTPLAQHQWILEHLYHEVECLVVAERPFEQIGITTIHPDYDQLARDTVQLFLKRGHREVFCFCGQYFDVWADPYTETILAALTRACEEAGLKFDRDCYRQIYPMPEEEAAVIIRDVFERKPEIDAIFCMYNIRLATIIAEMRKHHPKLDSRAVTIVDNSYKSSMIYQNEVDKIGIYRVRYPNYRIGEAMAAVFEERWESLERDPLPILNEIVAPGELF